MCFGTLRQVSKIIVRFGELCSLLVTLCAGLACIAICCCGVVARARRAATAPPWRQGRQAGLITLVALYVPLLPESRRSAAARGLCQGGGPAARSCGAWLGQAPCCARGHMGARAPAPPVRALCRRRRRLAADCVFCGAPPAWRCLNPGVDAQAPAVDAGPCPKGGEWWRGRLGPQCRLGASSAPAPALRK